MLQKIAIKMLGDFSVVADGRCVVDATAKLTKPWQLFCYLALNREHVTPSSVLLQELWGGEELADPANVLKNTVYALRRELAGPVKPAESPILFRAGGYCLNGHIKWSVDTERFEQLCEKAERCTGGSEAKMAAWRKAEGAFRGELLPQLAGEVWVMRAARGFTRRYLVSARALCACLAGENAYGELLDVASRASVTDPLDEDIALWTFRALDALHMQRAIVIAYNKTARYFEEEMGRPLCAEIGSIYAAAAEAVNKTEQDFAAIRDELSDALRSQRSDRGAFYCNYEVFKRMYAIVARTAQRARQVVALMLITVQGPDGGRAPEGEALAEAMDDLKLAIAGTLRKSDTFTNTAAASMRCCCPWKARTTWLSWSAAFPPRTKARAPRPPHFWNSAERSWRNCTAERRFKNRSRVTRPPVA